MRKLCISLLLTIISFAAFAQKITYGINAGVNIATIQASAQSDGEKHTTDSHLSSMVEIFADFRVGNFSLQPAIALTGKGGNVTTGDQGVGQFALHYLQIPLNLLYHFPAALGDIYVGGGPYIAFGTSGTLSVAGPGGDDTEDVTFGGTGDFSKTDGGLQFTGGVKLLSGLTFNLKYDLGLANILNSNGPEGGLGSFKTRTFGVSVGYSF